MEVANNATVRAEFIADVKATCPKLFPTSKIEAEACVLFGDAIIKNLLPFIDNQLETLAWDARAVCSNFIFDNGVPACLNPCCATPTIPEKLR